MSVNRNGKPKRGGVQRTANGAEIGLNQPILRTKLQRPPVAPDILPRARLLDRLKEGRQRTMTLISAPAGYGKSTLASRWMAACDSPSAWVSLDESDSDLHIFLSYVLVAIRSLFPTTELRTEALLEADQLPSVTVLASQLLNDLHQITEPFIFVLDDYHHIQESPVHDLVTELLAHPPRAMHLVLLTRRDPSLPISRLRGRGQVTEIRAADLRFTPAEAAGFLTKMLKVPVDDAAAALLDEKIEGWVTGLRLAGLYLRDQNDLEQRVRELSGSSRHITEYLLTEVLSRQNPEITAYLVETSILDRFCAPLCEAVFSKDIEGRNEKEDFDAQQFIEWLLEANIFVIPLDDQGYWYRYHHLFREFLQTMLWKQKKANTIAELDMKASNWFAENGLIEEAIRHALAAGDTPAAVRLVIEHRYDLMNTSQFHRLRRWLESLPEDAVAEAPLLVSARAFIGIEQGQDSDVYTYTGQAEQMLGRLSSESAEYATLKSEVHMLQGFIDMAVGNPDSGLTHAEEALNSPSLPEHALLMRSLGTLTKAFCHQMKGIPGQGVKVLREALLNPAWPPNIRARIHFYLAIAHYMDANLAGAMSSCHECLRIVRDLPFTHTKTFASYLLGASHYWRNDVAEAESHLLSVLDECEVSNPSYVANAGFILACMYLARDDTGQAEQVLSRIGSHFEKYVYATVMTIAQGFRAELALRQGDTKGARQLSKNIDFNIRPPLWFFYVPQLTPIKILLAEGTNKSLQEASARLVQLYEKMHKINRKSVLVDVLALLALVYHKLGEEAAALKNLRAALDLAEPGGWIRNFVDLGAPMIDLLERLNQAKPEHTYAQQVLAACKAEARIRAVAKANGRKASRLSEQAPGEIFTQREIELLLLLAEGLSNEQIAAKLFIAKETVKTHLQNIYRKLNTKGRMGAVKAVRKLGLIPRD